MIKALSQASMIATCGINCATCYAFQRIKNRCVGCLTLEGNKPNHCHTCKIRNCEFLASSPSGYCYDCVKFPCQRLKNIDKRYRLKYHSNLIQNLKDLKLMGVEDYMMRETERWTCRTCGGTLCVHKNECPACNGKPESLK